MSNLVEIQDTIKENKLKIALGQAVKRLSANRDFKLLIEQGYMIDAALRYLAHSSAISVSGSPNVPNEERRAMFTEMARAPQHLRNYLEGMLREGLAAEEGAEQLELDLEEAEREENKG